MKVAQFRSNMHGMIAAFHQFHLLLAVLAHLRLVESNVPSIYLSPGGGKYLASFSRPLPAKQQGTSPLTSNPCVVPLLISRYGQRGYRLWWFGPLTSTYSRATRNAAAFNDYCSIATIVHLLSILRFHMSRRNPSYGNSVVFGSWLMEVWKFQRCIPVPTGPRYKQG